MTLTCKISLTNSTSFTRYKSSHTLIHGTWLKQCNEWIHFTVNSVKVGSSRRVHVLQEHRALYLLIQTRKSMFLWLANGCDTSYTDNRQKLSPSSWYVSHKAKSVSCHTNHLLFPSLESTVFIRSTDGRRIKRVPPSIHVFAAGFSPPGPAPSDCWVRWFLPTCCLWSCRRRLSNQIGP